MMFSSAYNNIHEIDDHDEQGFLEMTGQLKSRRSNICKILIKNFQNCFHNFKQ